MFLPGVALVALVVLVAVVSPRVGSIDGRAQRAVATVAVDAAKEGLPVRCDVKAALDARPAADEDARLERLAALRACREERPRESADRLSELVDRAAPRERLR
jgi:hypothetical protein